jgi:Arc/MetJ-type ribon-helix-helix transcriptional regulator
MTIHLPVDLEASINDEVQSGRYASADEVVALAVRSFLCQKKAGQPVPGASSQESPDQWAERLQAWVDTHPSRPIEFDDSRESVYAGRGE